MSDLNSKALEAAREIKAMFGRDVSMNCETLTADIAAIIQRVCRLEEADKMRDALATELQHDRCEDPIRIPLPNPEGYREKVRLDPCGKCRHCKSTQSLAAFDGKDGQ